MRTNLERVWACGDITTFDGKLKLIATGFAEAAIAVSQAVHTIRPDMKIQPGLLDEHRPTPRGGRGAGLSADRDLRRDPVMAGLIDDFGGPLPTEPDSRGRPDDLYGALVRTIAGQQLSVHAARAIWRRLLEHFDGRVPTPQEILDEDPDDAARGGGLLARQGRLPALAGRARARR